MIPRNSAAKVIQLANQFKGLVIIGPRQSGKTTLARHCFTHKPYVSLETPVNRQFAQEDPILFLQQYPDGAIIDEIQRVPELLSWLQQNFDEDPRRGKFILTGSNHLLLLENITQTLAGRVAYLEQLPFSLSELKGIPSALQDLNQVMWKGGYPPIQADQINPVDWFSAYVRTYIERDVRQIKNIDNLFLFERFLFLCAGRVGQQLNYSSLANEVGVDYKTIQSWMSILIASYLVWLLPPWYKNFNKRVTKTPKLYFYDTGLACHLLRIQDPELLTAHPYRGALFENLMVNELLKSRFNHGLPSNLFYWKANTGQEIDVLIDRGLTQWPIEIKSGATLQNQWLQPLKYWNHLSGQHGGFVLYGGDQTQKRHDEFTFVSWRESEEHLQN